MVVIINGTDGISTPDVVVDSIGTDTSTAVAIRTNGVERMRVDNAGNVLVGTTSTLNGGKSMIDFSASSRGLGVVGPAAGGGAQALHFYSGTTQVGSIALSTTAASYNTTSDYRLKENVTPITDATNRVLSLNPVRFNFIADPDQTVDGFLAHEAQAVVPEAVTGEKDGEEMQAIDQSKLVPLLTAALQDALKTIQALEARVAALETPA